MTRVFYSFRRCPYAMRARLALRASGVQVTLREVVLRDKPKAFLAASPSATVPCLVLDDRVIDESLDVMVWALRQHDPLGWLDMPQAGWDWIARCDGPFKSALDRTKYATRYPECDAGAEREKAMAFLRDLDRQINGGILGSDSLADYAILPFVRQFAFIDKARFEAADIPNVQRWLGAFLASDGFSEIMHKYKKWEPCDPPVVFPDKAAG